MCLAEKKEFVIGKMQIEKEGRRKRRRESESSFCELPRVKLREREEISD